MSIAFFSCNQTTEKKENDAKQEDSTKRVIAPPPVQKLKFDAKLTATAQFIGGVAVENDTTFAKLQQTDAYKAHQKFVSATWKKVETMHLAPVKKWASEENITSEADSVTLFYPFSGPDFLYANTFFPFCKNYILVALERRGSVPEFSKMTDKQVANYLKGIQGSLDYLNKAGYFVTSHMGRDFSKQILNGNIHMIMYFLARTKHKIIDINTVAMQTDGSVKIVDADDKSSVKALQVNFTDSTLMHKKSIYYISIDASDESLATKPEFAAFVKSFPKKFSYMKAASYILMNPNFKTVRDAVLEQSTKILQDDTGVPYRYFTADSTYAVKLYGTYSGVIADLKYAFQRDLEKAVKKQAGTDLPFRISYNGWHNEGMLLFAKRKINY